jgi:hypothetical protein
MERERRRTPRYTFFASAELFEENSTSRVISRVSELGLHGCYLDMMNPFPANTLILLKITAGEVTIESKAQVVYSTPNMGAGVVFLDMEPKHEFILKRWLEETGKH